MSTGERLRQARLDTGKTLQQVAADTKIQLWILEALEREDFARVPGGVFIRGYLTAFARAVHLDPSDVLTTYSQETAPPPAPPLPPAPIELNDRPATPAWQYAVIAALVLIGALMWRNMTRSESEVATSSASAPVVTTSATSPSPSPAPPRPNEDGATATAGATPPSNPLDVGDGERSAAPLVVELHANDEVWIEATADGARKAYRLFEEGQELRLEAQKEIRLLVGDAGAVNYTINGKPARSLGGPGTVRQIVVSASTLPTLL